MVKFLIYRPIAVLMTALALVVLGLLAAGYIPISLMPDIDIPEITVQVDGSNRSARELEDAIIKPLRANLMQLGHLEDIKSETSNGTAIIRLTFVHGTPIDYAFIEVNEKVDRTMSGLPRDQQRPRVIKASATDIPVFYLNMTLKGDPAVKVNGEVTRQFVDFNRFINQVVRKRIEQIPEVALVDISGLVHSEILVVPDEQKLIALGIGLGDIEGAIVKENIDVGSILVKDSQYQYNLRLGSSLNNINDIGNIYIKKNDRLFQLKDLAQVMERPKKRTGLVLYNDKEAVTMALIKQSDVRMGDLKEALQESIKQMVKDYPDLGFDIVRDQTKLLDHAIGNLTQSLFWGMLLAFAVMFVFLKDIKSPLLIGISIPVSLIVSLLFFHLFQISINIVSLSGIILGIGLMIDNSIIVIDNITQYREMGRTVSQACIEGTNEVFRPLLSSVLTTCAVFAPLIFLSGLAGALFYDQAIAVSIGLFVSLLVSVTLLPVLYRLFHLKNGEWLQRAGRFMERKNSLDYIALYEKGFRFTMRRQPLIFGLFTIFVLLAIGLFTVLPKSQMPQLTSTETMVRLDWNEPINIEENKKRTLLLLEPIMDTIEEYSALMGQQQFLLEKNADAKTSTTLLYLRTDTQELLEGLKRNLSREMYKSHPNAVITYASVDNIFNLIFSDDAPPLTARLRNLENIGSSQNVRLKEVWATLQQGLPKIDLPPIVWENQIALLANTEKLMTYGVSSDLLNNALKSAFNQKEVLSITDNQNFVPVLVGSGEKTIFEVLAETAIRANDSTYYNVSDFVTKTPIQDLRTITAGREGEYYPLDLAIQQDRVELVMGEIRSVIDQNPHYDLRFTGSIFENRKLIKELTLVLGITLLLLYFILASQFESLTLPLIILLEVPIAMVGAFLFLFLFDSGINLMSMIGVVVMSGIIINDSILKMDTIIQMRQHGHSLLRSLLVAGQRRLKPILMTSLTTILALVPILLTGGLGGELQAPLAFALIGGLLIGTLVSLYFIPLMYYYLTKTRPYAK